MLILANKGFATATDLAEYLVKYHEKTLREWFNHAMISNVTYKLKKWESMPADKPVHGGSTFYDRRQLWNRRDFMAQGVKRI